MAALPLLLTASTGSLYSVLLEHEIDAFWLLKVHTGKFGWLNLQPVYPMLLGVLTILVTFQTLLDTSAGYQFRSSVESGVFTGLTQLSERDSVGAVLGNVVMHAWRDAVCGDGTCNSPHEFPSFGRFGCKADCGAAETRRCITERESDATSAQPP